MKKDEFKASLVLLAGGKGVRVGLKAPKQFVDIGQSCIALRALKSFLENALFSEYVIVCAPFYRSLFDEFKEQKNLSFAEPGNTRQHSLQNGLEALKEENPIVFVHDAARPFFDPKYIEPLFESAKEVGASVIGIPASSTLKVVDEQACIEKTLDRSQIWEAQTPQVAYKKTLLKGLKKAQKENKKVTDEASLIELLGLPVQMIKGDPFNFKVTFLEDLKLAEMMMQNNETDDEEILTNSCI